jgi:hypothetical protein
MASGNIVIELYGNDVEVVEHMDRPNDTTIKMNDSVRVEKKNDPNDKSIGVVSGIVRRMNNSTAVIYMVHFGHNMAGHDANYLEKHLVKVTIGHGGRRRKSRKSRKSRKARKTRRRH